MMGILVKSEHSRLLNYKDMAFKQHFKRAFSPKLFTISNLVFFPPVYVTLYFSSCLQIARAFGASQIIAVDVQDDKLLKAKTSGATHTINSRKEDAIEKITVCTSNSVVITLASFFEFHDIWGLGDSNS